jgi:hypothetical protein
MSSATAEKPVAASPPQSQPLASPRLVPLDVFPPGTDPLSPQRQVQWIWAFLAIGVAMRLARYLLRFPLWEDECMLSCNYFERDYLGLLQPLRYYQVAPPLFLWAQLTMVKLLGFTEYALRLIPFLCAVGGLFLFRHVAGRLLRGTALVLAVGLFAVSYPMIRYTAEAKPYGCDLFLALAMIALLVEWLRRPEENRWLWALAAIIGPAVGYSFPAVFVGGAISLVAAGVLWTSGQRRGWVPWAVFNLVLVGSVVALIYFKRQAVGSVNEQVHLDYWVYTFPPLSEPLEFLGWLATIHTGGMLGYPVGGDNWASTLSFVCSAVGIGLLARRRQWALLAICVMPLALNFAAAALHQFPYGGHMRMSLYMGSVFCLLISLGATAWLAWHAARRSSAAAPLRIVLGLLVLVAAGTLLHDIAHPYKSGTTLRARDFARWFWHDLAQDSELVCLQTDLKEDASPGTFPWGWSSLYLCNQRIYSPRHARGEPPQLNRVSAEWPLRCVLYRSGTQERDATAVERWLARKQADYRLVARDKYPFPIYDKHELSRGEVDYIEVFKFVPRGGGIGD